MNNKLDTDQIEYLINLIKDDIWLDNSPHPWEDELIKILKIWLNDNSKNLD